MRQTVHQNTDDDIQKQKEDYSFRHIVPITIVLSKRAFKNQDRKQVKSSNNLETMETLAMSTK